MSDRFQGEMIHDVVPGKLPPPPIVLTEVSWSVDPHNAAYLAGRVEVEPSHDFVELTEAQAFGGESATKLPHDFTSTDIFKVVGDISHTFGGMKPVIIARTSDFKGAGELADELGYRPAHAGEFLQLLWWLRSRHRKLVGWFYCYEGRKPGYAILAEYNGHCDPAVLRVIFDTHIGNQIEEGHVHSNAENYCFFVLKD